MRSRFTLCSMLSYNDGFTDMEVFAQTQVPWLRTFLKRREYQATAELGKWPKAGSGALAKRRARLPLVSSRRITEWRTRPRDTLLPQQPADRCRTPRANHPRHWPVENSCHHLLDVTFQEGHRRCVMPTPRKT